MMKNLISVFWLMLVLFQFSCDKEEDSSTDPNYEDINIVTGLRLLDANAQAIGNWNFPNDKPGGMTTYPNPAGTEVSVFFGLETLTKVWILSATCLVDSMTNDIPTLAQNLSYEASELDMLQIKEESIPSASTGTINLNLEDLPRGFYRVFYQVINGDIFWQNLFIGGANMPIVLDPSDLDGFCN